MYQEIAVKNISIHHRRNGVDQQKKYRSQLMMPISTEWETVYPKNIVSTLVRFSETDLRLLDQLYTCQTFIFFSITCAFYFVLRSIHRCMKYVILYECCIT